MLIPFLIMLREGIEAALIVGIVAGYLVQTGRARWLPMVWAGIVLASMICLALGIILHVSAAEFPQREQELFEGVVALVAAGILTSVVFWMRKAAHSMKGHLHDRVDAALRGGGGLALVGVVFLAVGREGLEFGLLPDGNLPTGCRGSGAAGALLGLACAVAIGFGIYRGGVRLDLRRFFRWTGVFIIFVAAGLLAGAVRALHEAGLWNRLQQTVFDLGHVLPIDSPVGTVLAGILGYNDAPSLGEVVVYLLYLIPALALFLVPPASRFRRYLKITL